MVYVHVPFCRSFCTYCDFYSEIACRGKDAGQQERYLEQLLAEIQSRRDEIAATGGTNTLYIGGGTPSVLPSAYIAAIARTVAEAESPGRSERRSLPGGLKPFCSGREHKNARCETPSRPRLVRGRGPLTQSVGGVGAADAFGTFRRGAEAAPQWDEFTVEVNPEDIVEKGEGYAGELIDAGVNRISMGVQSLDDGILRWMNRRHTAARAEEAFAILRRAGFRNISVDLIFGLSQLDDQTLRSTLEGILSWHPEHISAYQLSVEDGSALAGMVADGRYVEASDEQCRQQYDLICSVLAAAGYVHYEISNWALPGFEAVHNSAYWTRQPYVGLGPGAHSLCGNVRSWNSQELDGWRSEGESLSPEEVREEEIMLALRTAKGVKEWKCRPEDDTEISNKLHSGSNAVDEMLSSGLLERCDGRIRIPENMFFVSDSIIASLL